MISDRPRGERGTRDAILANKFTDPQGIGIGDLSADQKDLATQVMTDLLAPFREKDRDESMKLLNKQGLDNLHFAWFKHMNPITSQRSENASAFSEDSRAVEVERATGRIRCYSYNTGSWVQTC